ncbi:MAG: GRP family sugar transporter, partial [Candidatus Electryoneaceae bacterium]|nr:GRP family sugar transporter [Candidatus Electryoneaceae bacterium]
MFIVNSYPLAVLLCVVTMLCWGSWANTQKLASKEWSFPLFYWDYTLGVIILSLIFGLTLGSSGDNGESFIPNLLNAAPKAILFALLGGVIFNIANLLLVAAIEIAGMAIAFPIGIGLALVLGVFNNYLPNPEDYNSLYLFLGVGLVTLAIIINALAYKKVSQGSKSTKGIVLSLVAGLLMSFFYRFVADSMSTDLINIIPGTFTPYSAVFVFSIGIFISNFLFNYYFMKKPISGEPVTFSMYFKHGTPKLHVVGILGGIIWSLGMMLSIMAGDIAGYAISYGLGQGATLVAAIWGVFVWKEFKDAPKGTSKLLVLMFASFVIGLVLIILANGA